MEAVKSTPQSLPEDPPVDLDVAVEHGLSEEEYGWIIDRLGRTPTWVELGVYSVMWSEHCSYKNSITLIKTLPRTGESLLAEAGEENAGLVDIGEGLAVAFKIESHNHPSAVEPYQGAATGVGGIHRDIFTMGARPIAALNSLRFGSLANARVRFLFDGVVRGIGDYGNSFGVPTVGGEVYFDPAYEGNPLVNAMSVGIVKVGNTATATAEGVGNAVFIAGASTGRDGIHGATFASEEISEASEAKRPSVQVGDPFMEKLLLEATLEAIESGVVVGIQDMGAAGITCSSCEMSAKGESGMTLHLERVPIREFDMTPYEIMLSESQERMLIVCEPDNASALVSIFEKWDLQAAQIGTVRDDGRVKVYWHDALVADFDADHLVLGGGAPVYQRETRRPDYLNEVQAFQTSDVEDISPTAIKETLLRLLAAPNIASKRWVFEQYDTTVRTNTTIGPGPSDAAVIRIKGTNRGLALKTDCNGRWVYLNPRKGGQAAVAEAARNVVCAGGRPVAITNCLNFGNPYKPEVYWVFKEALRGMGEACEVLGTPVTGGNVSFYNENPDGAVFPTPTIGMLGLVDDLALHATTINFKRDGDAIFLLTPSAWTHTGGIEGSEYLSTVLNQTTGDAPRLDLQEELLVQQTMLALIQSGIVKNAHDISDGGLATCLAECVLTAPGLGASVDLTAIATTDNRYDAVLFGEAHSRIIFSVSLSDIGNVDRIVQSTGGVQATRIGTVDPSDILVIREKEEVILQVATPILSDTYEQAIPRMMAQV